VTETDDGLPEDAGEYADALRRILVRIPERWGRRLDVGPGWYLLIVELDQALAQVDAGYALLQVKEKFGGLRYYTQESDDLTVEGRERCAALIDEAERRSASTCETCGGSGSLHTNARRWFRTLCAGHAEESGYTKVAPAERDS